MSRSAWKACERMVARILGGTRNPITGRTRSQGAPDIEHSYFSIEVKHRKDQIPDWLLDAMDQAIQTKRTERHIPIVVLHKKGQKYEDSITLVKLSDLATMYKEIEDGRRSTDRSKSGENIPDKT